MKMRGEEELNEIVIDHIRYSAVIESKHDFVQTDSKQGERFCNGAFYAFGGCAEHHPDCFAY